jgi:autotransporter-associated beta strand protein
MNRAVWRVVVFVTVFLLPLRGLVALATDIQGVQPAALDQPRINAAFSLGPLSTGTLLVADLGGGQTVFNVQAFFDTGASGILLSNNTADLLGIERSTFNSQEVVFSDIGVAGTDDFNVSQPVHVSLARFHPDAFLDEQSDLTEYSHQFGPVRTQIGPIGVEPDPILGDLDVFGVPLMQNKVVVMDPRPVNTFLDTMRTYVYNPGTPFNAAAAGSDPGIPPLNNANSYHVRFSKADFGPFTTTTPAAADPPTLNRNPFIGPDPTNPQPSDPPPVEFTFGSSGTKTGSFLFDTGAAASMISRAKAAELGVTYDPNADPESPSLIYNGQPVANQFSLTIGGIGGTTKVAGFFLDTMTLPTVEGASDPNKNLNFIGAPVLVADITVRNPVNNGTFTLDGILGMNYFVASAFLTEAEPFPIIDALTVSAFDWVVYDDANSTIGLQINELPPLPGVVTWVGIDPDFTPNPNWDTNSSNWLDITSEELFVPYEDGMPVQFIDGSDALSVNIVSPVEPAQVLIDNSGAYPYSFSGAPITGVGGVVKIGTGSVTFLSSNTYTGNTDVRSGTVIFAAPQNVGAVVVRELGNLVMQTSQRFEGLRIDSGSATLTAGGDKVLVLNHLIISGDGRLDLADNDAIIDYSTPTTDLKEVRVYLLEDALMSSAQTAARRLGYADNAVLGRTTFSGQSVDPSSVLIKFTYAGDADLDGDVDVADLGALASAWQTESMWTSGDFDYTGFVDVADLGLLASNWQAGAGGTGAQPMPLAAALQSLGLPASAVPEPALAGVLAVLALVSTTPGRTRWNVGREH